MHSQYTFSAGDEALLDMLTGDNFQAVKTGLPAPVGKLVEPAILSPGIPPAVPESVEHNHSQKPRAFARRDAALDPLLLAAVFASGTNMTRNHYAHDFFPGVQLPSREESYDWRKFTGIDSSKLKKADATKKLRYVSRQMSRRERSAQQESSKENTEVIPPDSHPISKPRRASVVKPEHDETDKETPKNVPSVAPNSEIHTVSPSMSTIGPVNNSANNIPRSIQSPSLEVKCMARTRIPTPYGPVFLHLYHNNKDKKEHLAIVVDGVQQQDEPSDDLTPIRSRTLDASWGPEETEMDRIVRGAYVGKLGPGKAKASTPPSTKSSSLSHQRRRAGNPPLIRLHSECFTGETVGSMRCDCGEQLAEALRLISQSETKQGVVVYLRQEGRGIGLLNKIKAYNLQDMGADTVKANELLGFKADERGYEVVGGILRDLGLAPGGDGDEEKGVRLLTNNPDKVAALEKEGVKVVERVSMVPRSWQAHMSSDVPAHIYGNGHGLAEVLSAHPKEHPHLIAAPGGILGASAPYGADLDKYLRTKVERMGHMLPKVWEEGQASQL